MEIKDEKENSGEYPKSITDGNLSKGSFLSMLDALENEDYESDTYDGIADGIIYIMGISADELINSLMRIYEEKYDRKLSY